MMSEKAREITKANQKMHDILANYYDISNMIMWEEGKKSQLRVEQMVKTLAAETSAGCLADVGCGTGFILKYAQNHFKKTVGIDVSFEMLLRNKGRKVKLVRGDINSLPIKSSYADTVTSFSVIHHLYEFDDLFGEIYRILKPNGQFYSDNDPNIFSMELHDLKKQSAAFRFLMGIYFIPLRFSRGFRERSRLMKEFSSMLNNKGIKEFDKLSLEAEYHLQKGLNPYEIKQKLEKAGFVNVRIYFHFRGNELRNILTFSEKLSLLVRMLLKPKFSFPPPTHSERKLTLLELAPYFAIRATKPSN